VGNKKPDYPFPTDFELFLLLVIQDTTDSVYELQRQLAINPGAAFHAIERLESKGALKREPKGSRGKRRLTVTSEGHDILKTHWRGALQHPFEDVQNLIRLALIVVVMGGSRSPRLGAQLLRDKADEIERSAKDTQAPELLPGGELADRTDLYSWIQGKTMFHQARAMGAALRDVAEHLARLPEDD
jgi:DNA-binding MarR family transcriptional regulator